ncbi:MAG: VWA domain-containing protein [Actinomycetota bacterium]|nr:VWA domain-containing protein [Actinomycetota bacterium]
MNAFSMSLANPAGLALLGLAVPVVLLHILRPRRQAVTVSSTFLWRSIERPVSSASPWQRLRWSLLLLAQLLAVALLATAVARPVRLEAAALSEHTVFIIDASGSMAALDGNPDRLHLAVDRAVQLRKELPTGGIASVVIASDRPRVVLTASDDPSAFAGALRTVETTTGHPDFAGAFSLAESLDTSSAAIGFVLISDGGLTTDEQKLLPPGTRYERVGSLDTNRAIARVDVEPRGSGLHARVTVRNYGGTEVTQPLRIDVDGTTVNEVAVKIGPRSSVVVEADLPPGDRVEAYLDAGNGNSDVLAADDVGVAVGARRPDLKVLIAGDTRFWQELFTSMPGVETSVIEVAAGAAAPDGDGYDVVVYSGVRVPAEPKASFLAVASPGGIDGVTVNGVVETPSVTLLRTDDALLADVDLTKVAIAQALRVTAGPDVEVLVAGENAPLLLRGESGGHRFAFLTFALADSNLPLQVAFPILGDRLLTELSGTAVSAASIQVGASLPIDPSTAGQAVGPDGQARPFAVGDPALRATLPGFWVVQVDGANDRLVAVNPATAESDVSPRDTVVPPPNDAARDVTPARTEHSLLPWVLWPLLALLLLEGWLAWRRLGVGRVQWRFAVAARLLVAALLLGALLAPTIRRSSDRVATVFVLDGSASLGPAGDAAALLWLQDALSKRPDDALSAVVVFGGDARLDRVLEQSSTFEGAAVVIDDTSTDIATALRLGGAVLPSDARRRVVIISDGRATSGDALEEARQLAGDNVQIEVHTIDTAIGADAAVLSIDVPRLARVGDEITVDVNVVATQAGRATVVLRRDGDDVGTRVVDLQAGTNVVTFTDNAGDTPAAVLRYQAVVTSAGDAQPKNDAAFAAVPVDGPARVLIVEGTGGESATLDAALQAGGVATDVVGPAEVPDVQGLATYAGIVLVNVPASSLTGEQIEALTVAVRDLGRGMVTIGGTRSYGVGGYRDSPLSDLLPVDSEILDPKRRKTVAEVLSIDTSGSMAACHCDSGTMNPGVEEGGVNKTDISRAAAERTIEALTQNDQVGVMAWSGGTDWVIDLQTLPSQAVIDDGLGRLRPDGGTNIMDALDEPAEQLLASNAELKHIIVFTDGFTDVALIERLAERAGELFDEFGITVSVLATGEGAAPSLEAVAVAGHGRYYPGTSLADVPQIMAEEAVIASRDFINEGEFLPEVTSNDPVVAPLTASPQLLGYVATTAKPEASTLLRIGPDRDPLLATWQAGLGRVDSWTSDASATWSQNWAGWDGYVDFWSRVVKSTFQQGDSAGAAQAQVAGGRLHITVEGASNFPDGAVATATVAGPDGQRYEVPLDRTGGDTFEAEIPADRSGTYAVGVNVTDDGETVLASSTLASESYPAEYAPGESDGALMTRLSQATEGRGEIQPAQAWDAAGLAAGYRRLALALPFLIAAAILWPIAVTLSRLSVRGATVAGARTGLATARRRLRAALPRLGSLDPDNAPARPRSDSPSASGAENTRRSSAAGSTASTTPAPDSKSAPPNRKPAAKGAGKQTAAVNELLAKKRARQGGGSDDAPPTPG